MTVAVLALCCTAQAGTLAGAVVDASGDPVGGAVVTVLDPRLAWSMTETDGDGRWEIGGLPPNPYRVVATPPDDWNLLEQFAPDVARLCDGTTFQVPKQGRTDGADVTLAVGGEVRGTLQRPNGAPVVGATVASEGAGEAAPRGTVTDDEGSFVLTGLPDWDGALRLEVDGFDLPDQYVGPSYVPELAVVVEPGRGEVVSVGTHSILEGISVGGTVFGPDGLPVSDGVVHAYTPSQLRTTDIEADGSWLVEGLPPGDVLAWSEVDGLGATYWPDADRPLDRLALPAEGDASLAMDLSMPAEATVVGRMLGEVDWEGASVLLYNSDRTVGFASLVDAEGRFEVVGLHGGTYTLYVNASSQGFVSDFYEDASGSGEVVVPDSEVADVGDVELPIGAILSGTVLHEGTGEPVFGATVYVQSQLESELELGIVDQDGSFVVDGLTAGPWQIWVSYQAVCASDPGFVTLYSPDEPNVALSAPVVLAEGERLSWHVRLPPDDEHDGMSDLWEQVHDLDPSRDDGGLDADDDGYTNLDEYLLGTDPNDDASHGGCGCVGAPGVGWAPWLLVVAARRRRVSR